MKADPLKTRVLSTWQHTAPLMSCKFDPSGRYVFATSEDRGVYRWDLSQKPDKPVSFVGHDSWPWALAFSPDGKTLYSGGFDGRLIWHDALAAQGSKTPLRSIQAHKGWIRALAASPDGTRIISAGGDLVVRIWSALDGGLIHELKGHTKHIYSLKFHPNGYDFASGDLKGDVFHWELPTGKLVRKFDGAKLHTYEGGQQVDYGGIRDLTFSPDGKWLIASGLIEGTNPLGAVSTPAFLSYDWQAKAKANEPLKEAMLHRFKENLQGVGWGVRFHPDGFFIGVVGGNGGGHLGFFRPGQVNQFANFNLTNTGRGVDLHPDGLRIATAHHDRQVRLCSMTA